SHPSIEADRLRFGYREMAVFDGISLSVAPGEMVALIGPNGSGKTTLLKLLSGSLRAGGGQIRLGGRPLTSLAAGERARLVAVVPQDTFMTFDFTVMETVLMGRTAYLGILGVEGPEDIAAAREALSRTGTLPFAGRLLTHLSGGERQLVVIARALAQRPKVLLLDEPTAFLDIRHRLEIYALLSRLNGEEGLTIVTTSHDINLAARYCRRVVLIKEGRIRADGTPAQVFRPQILSDVFDTPLHVVNDPQTGIPYAMPALTWPS
ncbi:MAG: ABC transporter ATP-binding protein, partial [bacterium]